VDELYVRFKTMIRHTIPLIATFALFGCNGADKARPSALPDNVMEDRPIVIKEGQAIVIVPDGNRSLMIGASVIDGKLSISEIDPKGRSLSVTWSDEDTWETTVTDSSEDQTTVIIDKNGDGFPNVRAVMSDGVTTRYTPSDPQWTELQR